MKEQLQGCGRRSTPRGRRKSTIRVERSIHRDGEAHNQAKGAHKGGREAFTEVEKSTLRWERNTYRGREEHTKVGEKHPQVEEEHPQAGEAHPQVGEEQCLGWCLSCRGRIHRGPIGG